MPNNNTTIVSYSVLKIIDSHPELYQTQIARIVSNNTDVKPNTVIKSIRMLEDNGYISCEYRYHKRLKKAHYTLLPAGIQLLEELKTKYKDSSADRISASESNK